MNPFYCYAVSFLVGTTACLLNWSNLYPRITYSLTIFLFLTIIVHFILGHFLFKKRKINNPTVSISISIHALTTLFIYLLWIAEFFYEGGIPIVKILLKQEYNYRLFGIPHLHVFIVTFASFYTVFIFQQFLANRSKILLILFLCNLFAAILIYSRAMFVFNLISCMMVYWLTFNGISRSKLVFIALFSVPLIYLFGVLGSLRVSREAKTEYTNNHFLEIGGATEQFRNSVIPGEFFWTYIYVTSPLANLQQNINKNETVDLSGKNFTALLINEALPDFVSKRINRWSGFTPPPDERIVGPFNISTVYSKSYSYAGWSGIIVLAMILIIVPYLFLKILPFTSPYFLSGWSILCTMYLFMAYDNTIKFTGLSLQLFYPIFLDYLGRKGVPARISTLVSKISR